MPLLSGSVNRACSAASRYQPTYANVSSTSDASSPSRAWNLNSGDFVRRESHARWISPETNVVGSFEVGRAPTVPVVGTRLRGCPMCCVYSGLLLAASRMPRAIFLYPLQTSTPTSEKS